MWDQRTLCHERSGIDSDAVPQMSQSPVGVSRQINTLAQGPGKACVSPRNLHTARMKTTGIKLLVLGLFGATACTQQAAPTDPAATVNDIADRYYEWALKRAPERAYFAAIDVEHHDGLFDNSPAAQAEQEKFEDALLAEMLAIDIDSLAGTTEWVSAALLTQRLKADVDLRVCRQEGWNVSQMGGWHLSYTQVAQLQPVESDVQRAEALTRWAHFAAFADQELENLKAGLKAGYSAPQPIVQRVIDQIDGLLNLPVAESPFNSPGTRSDDEVFATAMQALVEDSINPAMRRYRDYLESEYLSAAREELSITDSRCQQACGRFHGPRPL